MCDCVCTTGCICVCMCIYIYVCVCVYIYIYTYICEFDVNVIRGFLCLVIDGILLLVIIQIAFHEEEFCLFEHLE